MRGSLPINVTEDHDHIAKCVLLACCHHEGCFRCSRSIKVACSTIGKTHLCTYSSAVRQYKLGSAGITPVIHLCFQASLSDASQLAPHPRLCGII